MSISSIILNKDFTSSSQNEMLSDYVGKIITGQKVDGQALLNLKASGLLDKFESEMAVMGFLAQKLRCSDPSKMRKTSSNLPGFEETQIRELGYKLGALSCSNAMMRFFGMNEKAVKKYDLNHEKMPKLFTTPSGDLGP